MKIGFWQRVVQSFQLLDSLNGRIKPSVKSFSTLIYFTEEYDFKF